MLSIPNIKTLGLWASIVSAIVATFTFGMDVRKSNVELRQRVSKYEGIVDQLSKTVNNLEEAQLRHDRSIDNNSRRIAYTQDSVEKTKKEIPKLKESLAAVKSQIE